jgi:hypothetical protein
MGADFVAGYFAGIADCILPGSGNSAFAISCAAPFTSVLRTRAAAFWCQAARVGAMTQTKNGFSVTRLRFLGTGKRLKSVKQALI